MARRPFPPLGPFNGLVFGDSLVPCIQEPRGSKDPRVQFVEIPGARRLVVIVDATKVPKAAFESAIVWIRPMQGVDDQQLIQLAETIKAFGALRVLVLPRDAEDVDLPANAGSPAPTSDVSEVRPVVAELVNDLPEELREDVAAFVERELSEAGL